MVMVAPVEATCTMVSQFSILQQKYGCFSAVLAVYGQIRAGRCSTRRGGFRKTPRAPLARTRGNEMITRVQRALSTKSQPSRRFWRVFVTYLIAPAYLDVNGSKKQRKPSWWPRFINFGAFPPSPPSLAQNEAVFEACFGCQVWGLERHLSMP